MKASCRASAILAVNLAFVLPVVTGQGHQLAAQDVQQRQAVVEEVAEEQADVAEAKEDAAAVDITLPGSHPTATSSTTKPAEETKDSADAPTDAPEAETPKAPPLDPQAIRLFLMDGSVIGGKLIVKEITVETRFGNLKIPIESIRSFTPGLDSYPNLEQQVSGLIEQLGSDDYAQRESSRKELFKMGLPIQAELKRRLTDSNAERVRHLKAILGEFEQQADDEAEDGAKSKIWIRQDTIETTDFTVVGRISPKTFEVTSTYGPLNIKLADIRNAQRAQAVKEEVRKSLSVEGTNLAQLSFKNSGIRVERGDRISVTAEGSIVMSPWGSGSISTPDGGPNFGWYVPNQIYGGALVGKISDGGQPFKIGAKSDFTADRSGSLQFAIAMQHEYAQGNYQFPGKYDLKIKVAPK